jgi:hypothetical protein
MAKKNKRITNNSARVVRIAIRSGEGNLYLNFLPGDKNIVSAEEWAQAMANKVAKLYTQEGSVRGRTGKVEKGVLLSASDVEAEATVPATKSRVPVMADEEKKKPSSKKDKDK